MGRGQESAEHANRFEELVTLSLRKLDRLEEQVLRLRYGIDSSRHSQEELQVLLGVAPDKLRAVERRALRRLRAQSVGSFKREEVAPAARTSRD